MTILRETPLQAEQPQTPSRPDWVVPTVIGIALFMWTINSTAVYNALPVMAQALHEDLLRLNLVVTIFMMSATVCMPASAWVADRYGAKRVFMLSIVIFALASAACGFAQTLTQVLIARAVQGLGGALLLPVARLVLLRTTQKSELVGAMAVLSMPAMVGPVIGPLLGGAIVSFFNWRWIFFMNLPIAAAGLYFVHTVVPDVKEQEVPPLDWIGVVLTAVGLSAFVYAVESIRDAAASHLIAALFAVSAAALGAYWLHARNRPDAIIDLSLFRIPSFSAAVVGGSFMRLGVGALPFLLTMLLMVCFGMSAFTAGVMTFISSAAGLAMKGVTPPILRRFGFRGTLIVNGVLVGVTFAICALLTPLTPHWVLMLVLGLGGFFRSLQYTALNGLVYAETEQHHMSKASAVSSMIVLLAQSVGVGVCAAALQLAMTLTGRQQLTTGIVASAFLVVGVVSLISVIWFARLHPMIGDDMHGGD